MPTYIMIIIMGYQATYIEYQSGVQCAEAQASLVKELHDKTVAVQCFTKIGTNTKM